MTLVIKLPHVNRLIFRFVEYGQILRWQQFYKRFGGSVIAIVKEGSRNGITG